MEAEKIARINELAKKRKSPEGLTAEEEAERAALPTSSSSSPTWRIPMCSTPTGRRKSCRRSSERCLTSVIGRL